MKPKACIVGNIQERYNHKTWKTPGSPNLGPSLFYPLFDLFFRELIEVEVNQA